MNSKLHFSLLQTIARKNNYPENSRWWLRWIKETDKEQKGNISWAPSVCQAPCEVTSYPLFDWFNPLLKYKNKQKNFKLDISAPIIFLELETGSHKSSNPGGRTEI